jgi:CHAT domain-containing protein
VAGPGNDRGEAEIRAIAALRPGSTVLTGAGATPEATLRGLPTVALAHVAAHGHHESDNPLFSTLELCGGPLMGYDLQRLTRAPAIVVLSSCDLGLTQVRPGDETLGMAAALLSVGTGAVVASVSRIADDTAMDVMTRYHARAAADRPPAAALAEAGSVVDINSFICIGAG